MTTATNRRRLTDLEADERRREDATGPAYIAFSADEYNAMTPAELAARIPKGCGNVYVGISPDDWDEP